RALDELTKLHGAESIDARIALNCLADVTKERGDYPAARSWLERAIAIDRKVLGEDHPHTAEDLEQLAEIELRTGNFEQGLAIIERVVAVRERVYGATSDLVAKSLLTM